MGIKFTLAFPATEGFAKQNGLHKSYLRELLEQTDFKDLSALIVGIKMDMTNYQWVSESFQSGPPRPPLRNTLSAINVVCLKYSIRS